MIRVITIVAVLAITFAGCSGGADSDVTEPQTAPAPATTGPVASETASPTTVADTTTSTQSAGFEPATASDEEKKARYLQLAEEYGVEERLLIDDEVFDEDGELIVENQIVQVAEVQCNNQRDDWQGFFDGMSAIEPDLGPVAVNRAALLDAFCPEARALFEEVAATYDVGVPPPPES